MRHLQGLKVRPLNEYNTLRLTRTIVSGLAKIRKVHQSSP